MIRKKYIYIDGVLYEDDTQNIWNKDKIELFRGYIYKLWGIENPPLIVWYPLNKLNLSKYSIDVYGRCKNNKKKPKDGEKEPPILKPTLHFAGQKLRLTMIDDDGKKTSPYVAKLVAAMFLPPPPKPSSKIGYSDGDFRNCHVSNLYWLKSKSDQLKEEQIKNSAKTIEIKSKEPEDDNQSSQSKKLEIEPPPISRSVSSAIDKVANIAQGMKCDDVKVTRNTDFRMPKVQVSVFQWTELQEEEARLAASIIHGPKPIDEDDPIYQMEKYYEEEERIEREKSNSNS